MQYDFDEYIERTGTDSMKWDRTERLFGSDDVLPMWVADMDLPVPVEVIEKMKERLEHPLFGYTAPSESLFEAIIDRMKRFYNWDIEREWIVFNPGVVNALSTCIDSLSRAGDEVILQSPVYYPFFSAIENNGCKVVNNQLAYDGSNYSMDFEDLKSHFEGRNRFPVRKPRVKALILCNPHNPVGRVWSPEELEQLAEICLENDCVIISDEIHCDLLVSDARHTVLSNISEAIEKNTITLMAPSKTFNLAGLKASFTIIPDPEKRRQFSEADAGGAGVNAMGLIAIEAALRHGDDYVKQLNDHLKRNVQYFKDEVNQLPGIKVVDPEGTYLVWVDMRDLGMDDDQLERFMIQEAKIATDFGFAFGPGGEGFQRFNLACPKSIVEEAVERLKAAVSKL